MRADVIQRARERCGIECAALAHAFAAEAKAAIDRADGYELQKHAVRVTMHDAGNGTMRLIADGVGELGGRHLQLAGVGQELPCDRIIGIGAVDERRNLRREGYCVAVGDRAQRLGGRDEACRGEIVYRMEGALGHAEEHGLAKGPFMTTGL